MDRIKKAVACHDKGYNCCQAVVCAFADKMDLKEEACFKAAEGLGLGTGDTFGTCGAVAGMALVLGMVNSTGNLDAPNSKAATYQRVRKANEAFRLKNGSTICRVLKGIDSGEVLRSCQGCIEDAVAILAKELGEE